MKLYYSPGACSMASHIAAREAGIPVELVRVDLREHKTEHGEDFYAISPKGYIPTLELDDGRILTEGVVILQYLGDLAPDKGLVPKADSFERYTLQEWLNFVATEIHKTFSALYYGNLPEENKKVVHAKLMKRLSIVEKTLESHDYLMGDFTVADAYCFTVVRWKDRFGIEIEGMPNLMAYLERVGERAGVKEAMAAEGL